MNQTLLDHYLRTDLAGQYSKTLQTIAELKIKSTNPMEILNTQGIPWSYEILNEIISEDHGPRSLHITVSVYMPGTIRTGVGSCKLTKKEIDIQSRKYVVKDAINEAISTIGIEYIMESPIALTTHHPSSSTEVQPEVQPESSSTESVKGNKLFTKEQIQRVRNLKDKLSIKTDDEFNKYLQRWKKDTTKAQLTVESLDEFLHFMGIE